MTAEISKVAVVGAGYMGGGIAQVLAMAGLDVVIVDASPDITQRHLERLVREEVDVMMERVPGEMGTEEAADLLEQAVEPMRDLVAALRAKLLVAELQARRAAQQT